MENIDVLNLKRKVRELEKQHNNLTALVKVLYANLKRYRMELNQLGNSSNSSSSSYVSQQNNMSQSRSLNNSSSSRSNADLKADEILSQLAANIQ
jgi:hypothetical protein